jgi:hypothetical protein
VLEAQVGEEARVVVRADVDGHGDPGNDLQTALEVVGPGIPGLTTTRFVRSVVPGPVTELALVNTW